MIAGSLNIFFKRRSAAALRLILTLILIVPGYLSAQHTRHVVFFANKAGTIHTLSHPSEYLSPKAIERRERYGIAIDSTDLPVSPAYVNALNAIEHIEVLSTSKWLNAALIKVHQPEALEEVHSLPFIKSHKAIAYSAPPAEIPLEEKKNYSVHPYEMNEIPGTRAGARSVSGFSIFNYGSSYGQINLHKGAFLHDSGYTGKGITIAMIDAGYSAYLTNPAFDSMRNAGRLLGGYDFVLNTPGISTHHNHGSYCLSVIATNLPGKMVGTAPHASFWLLRSEDAASEYLIEEYYWARAAEFADSVGADIISSSLGYTSFDDPAMNHTHATRDGNTSMSTIAADLAAAKGMIVVNSAGNNGGFATDERYVSCPADGDSVLAVGAIDADLNIAGFSSWGPNGSGKVKPNVVSIGQGTVLADAAGNPVTGNGTSFSAPIITGLIASLWQAFPEFSNMEIIAAVENSAHKRLSPDQRFGYGIPDFKKAYIELQQKRVLRNLENLLSEKDIKIFPNPFRSSFNIQFIPRSGGRIHIRISDAAGRTLFMEKVTVSQTIPLIIPINNLSDLPSGVYFISVEDAMGIRTQRLLKTNNH